MTHEPAPAGGQTHEIRSLWFGPFAGLCVLGVLVLSEIMTRL